MNLRDRVMQQDLEERKQNRVIYLKGLYEVSNGGTSLIINLWRLGRELHLSRAEVRDIVDYLLSENLIESRAWGGGISLSHRGLVEVERLLSFPVQKLPRVSA